jgi:6-pyruvoyltetrahydropterin/6-carboxytetrahydropterin synthase
MRKKVTNKTANTDGQISSVSVTSPRKMSGTFSGGSPVSLKGTYYATKHYGAEQGLSCVFRQWRAVGSHCSLLHGYALGVTVVVGANSLDSRNWVFNFSNFKVLKSWLVEMFDHTVVLAQDDPQLNVFKDLDSKNLIKLKIVPAVGCEKFAELVFRKMSQILEDAKNSDPINTNEDAWVDSVTVHEHGANSATFKEESVQIQ